jgi:hypothetical protein
VPDLSRAEFGHNYPVNHGIVLDFRAPEKVGDQNIASLHTLWRFVLNNSAKSPPDRMR